ncbi:MAG: acetyl/propionyl/methylcrotonyl-CoA carboxylase subunit alpha [Vicinamibacterales bacterium]
MIRRVLVANRGEIALRVIRACRVAGLETVAVYSDADAGAPHVLAADRAARIGPPPPVESYLNVAAIVDAARAHGADAVHPGYGFLSERAPFARAVENAGLVFIGPPAAAIEKLGSKTGARALMEAAGVPVVPGATPRDQGEAALAAAAAGVGVPLLVKPAAGGGGIGMKVVRELGELPAAVAQARREATAAFGNGHVYLERLIERPRHVEIQVFGDRHGRLVHLFERECSAQRRHQKVVEETPCPVLTPALRSRMGDAAVAAAAAVGYQNAGTVEFLLEGEGDDARFYFLEINTRLQVEHPITECVVGVDLVQAQLAVAAGAPLPWQQADLAQRGHAIECRVYAEDPGRGFLPQAGPLWRYREPAGPGIRVDAGVVEGGEVSVYYDPLLAKLVVWGASRAEALARTADALRRFEVLGVTTNLAFLQALVADPAFAAARLDTGFIDRELARLTARRAAPVALVAAAAWHAATTATGAAHRVTAAPAAADPFDSIRGWRG